MSRCPKLSLTLMAAALIGVFFIVPCSNAAEDTGDSRTALQLELQRLEGAADIVLMIIPWGVSFRFSVDKERLPDVSCIYQISPSKRGSSSADVRAILQQSIVEFQKGYKERLSEVRIGIFFRDGEQLLQIFYFEDWGGAHDIKGVAGEYRILANAGTPDRLRALVTRPDVVLIRSSHFECPHS
jgi:hypothetical protein